jgi:hypothetical protein
MSAVAETTRRPPLADTAQCATEPVCEAVPESASLASTQPAPQPPSRVIRARRDLATLPEPRVLAIAPLSLRAGIALMAGCYVMLGAWRLAAVLTGVPGATSQEVTLALLTILLGVCMQAILKPWDWRAWVGFAVTSEGLYLPGRGRKVVFVPWLALVDIEPRYSRAGRPASSLRLTLRLDPQNWARVSRFARIEHGGDGEGRVRIFHLPTRSNEAGITAERIAELNPLG